MTDKIEKIKENLTEENQKILDRDPGLAKKLVSSPKLIYLLGKLYKKLCADCKRMVVANPDRQIEDFCEGCQPKAGKIVDKINKKLRGGATK